MEHVATNCPNLEMIDLSNCAELSGNICYHLVQQCQHLKFLNLSGFVDKLSSSIFNCLHQNMALEQLILSNTVIPQQVNFKNSRLSSLKQLSVCGSIKKIRPIIQLLEIGCSFEELDLGYCPEITEEFIIALVKTSKNLKSISFANCQFLNDNMIRILVENCPFLERLNLSNTHGWSPAAFISILQFSQHLKYLNLSQRKPLDLSALERNMLPKAFATDLECLILHNVVLQPDSTIHLLSNCPQLLELDLSNNGYTFDPTKKEQLFLSDDTFSFIIPFCRNLKKLILRKCVRLTDTSIMRIAENFTFLEYLDISEINTITNISPLALCNQLKILILKSCNYVISAALKPILKKNCIQKLNIIGCAALKDDTLVDLYNCTSISELHFGLGHKMAKTDVEKFLKDCATEKPHLKLNHQTTLPGSGFSGPFKRSNNH